MNLLITKLQQHKGSSFLRRWWRSSDQVFMYIKKLLFDSSVLLFLSSLSSLASYRGWSWDAREGSEEWKRGCTNKKWELHPPCLHHRL